MEQKILTVNEFVSAVPIPMDQKISTVIDLVSTAQHRQLNLLAHHLRNQNLYFQRLVIHYLTAQSKFL